MYKLMTEGVNWLARATASDEVLRRRMRKRRKECHVSHVWNSCFTVLVVKSRSTCNDALRKERGGRAVQSGRKWEQWAEMERCKRRREVGWINLELGK